jgi:hypothetical protein
MVTLLSSQALLIDRQAELAEVNENRAEDLAILAAPLLRTTKPLVDDLGPSLSDLRADAPRLRRASKEATGLVRATRPLVADLARTDAPGALAAAGALAVDLLEDDRLLRTLTRADRVLARGDAFLERFDPDELMRELRRANAIAEEGLAVQRELLAVQKEALARIRSLDQKTGGTPPVATPTPAVPRRGG